MERTRALVTGPLAGWTGRLLLLGAVVFWWGAVVVPNLISLAFPAWLPPESIPRDLNPDIDFEGRLANRVSTAALLVLAGLAFANAVVGHRSAAGRVVVGGWSVLAVTALLVAWEETTDFHSTVPTFNRVASARRAVGSASWTIRLGSLGKSAGRSFCSSDGRLLCPRVAMCCGAAALRDRIGRLDIRAPVRGHHSGPVPGPSQCLDDGAGGDLEFGGTLLVAMSAVAALGPDEWFRDAYRGRRLAVSIFGSAFVVMALGSLFVGLVFRAPLVDARATAGHEKDWVSLEDGQSVAQGFPMPAAPISRLSLRLANRNPVQRTGVAIWRVMESATGSRASVLREGRVEVAAGDLPAWIDVDFPLLAAGEGRELFLQVVAEIEADAAATAVGMVKGDRYADGRLWVNGELTWPDQDLEFVAHGASEPTRSKFQSLWHVMTSDWHWPAQIAKAAVALMFVTLIPVLLIVAIWRRPGVGGIPSGLR